MVDTEFTHLSIKWLLFLGGILSLFFFFVANSNSTCASLIENIPKSLGY